MKRSLAAVQVWAGAFALSACTGPAPSPRARALLAPPSPVAQASYCQKLQPLLDRSTQAAGLGTKLACLDVPGVTELGRYGGAGAAEEESLANCFSDVKEYQSLIEAPEGGVELAIDDAFVTDQRVNAGAKLSELVPWLPKLDVSQSEVRELKARVSIKNARFVTLVGVASRLLGQAREEACLAALCGNGTSYVQKALVGTPTVVISALDAEGRTAGVGLLGVGADFAERSIGDGRSELSSKRPVTLAVARARFRTPQTERLCALCGRKGQTCCAAGAVCDAGLGCFDDTCVEVGNVGQLCDLGECRGGASCVKGRCELECGRKGQPCCGGDACGSGLRCLSNPKNWIEHRRTGQNVTVEGFLLGTDEDQTFGRASCGALIARERFAVTKVGSGRGNCERAWWYDRENVHDCRVGVHFSVAPFGSVTCRIEVFAMAPPQPNLCSL